jgi:hypothetical protein
MSHLGADSVVVTLSAVELAAVSGDEVVMGDEVVAASEAQAVTNKSRTRNRPTASGYAGNHREPGQS